MSAWRETTSYWRTRAEVATDLVEVHGLLWQFLSSYQRANPSDDVRGQLVVGHDLAEDLPTHLPLLVAQWPESPATIFAPASAFMRIAASG
jgi:hypothetical protein